MRFNLRSKTPLLIFIVVLIIVLMDSTLCVYAQTKNSSTVASSTVASSTIPSSIIAIDDLNESLLESQQLGYFGTRSISFINTHFQNPETRTIHYLEARLFRQPQDAQSIFGFDLQGQWASNQKELSHFTLSELYLKQKVTGTGFTFFLGRHKSSWSLLDDQWKVGAFQPIYKVDALNPRSQGLTGLFMNFKGANWELELFGTSLFLPDQGPQVEAQNGHFVKRDTWVYYPPSEVKVNGVLTPIDYNIDQPTPREVVNQKGWGFNAQWGNIQEEGLAARMGWAYKPMNQMLLGLNGFMVLEEETLSAENHLDIQLRPEVGYHNVRSMDLTYKFKQFLFTAGILDDVPQKKEFAAKWTYQNHTPSQLRGAGVQFLAENGWTTGLSYLEKLGGHSQVFGPEKDLVGDYFPERYSFEELIKVEISYHKNFNSRYGYEFTGEWRKELKEGSELASLQGALLIGSLWKTYLGLDLLRSENKVPSKKDFLEANLSNDRVYGGLQYVF